MPRKPVRSRAFRPRYRRNSIMRPGRAADGALERFRRHRFHQWIVTLEPWGILAVVFALIVAITQFWMEYEDRVKEREVRAWQLVTTPAAGNSGKSAALEYLNEEDGFLCFGWLSGMLGWLHDGEERNSGCFILLKRRTKLVGIDLSLRNGGRGAFLEDINLRRSVLQHANLKGANLTGATLTNADLTEAILAEANLAGAGLARANLISADLTGVNLTDADLTEASLLGADLTEAILVGTDMTGARLSHANLTRAILVGADLTGALLVGVRLKDAVLRGEDVTHALEKTAPSTEEAPWRKILWGLSLRDWSSAPQAGVILRGANLMGADMAGANLEGLDLSGAELAAANLTAARLMGATLAGVKQTRSGEFRLYDRKGEVIGGGLMKLGGKKLDLTHANLTGADLTEADLVDAVLRNANLTGAKLTGANLAGADLTIVHGLQEGQLSSACGDARTLLPKGRTIPTCGE